MLEVQVLRVLQCAFNRFLHSGSIFRVNTFEEQLQRRLYRSLILKNPKGLVGPAQVSGRNVPAEAPRTAERLRLRKVGLPTLQFLSQPLLLGNVYGGRDKHFSPLVLHTRSTDTTHVPHLTIRSR